MNDRIDAVLVDTSVYHKRQCDCEGITNSIIPMLLQLLRAMEEVMRLNSDRQYFERYLCFYGESAIISMYICEEWN